MVEKELVQHPQQGSTGTTVGHFTSIKKVLVSTKKQSLFSFFFMLPEQKKESKNYRKFLMVPIICLYPDPFTKQ